MAPKWSKKAPKSHFWVTLTHFGMALVGLLGIIIRIKAPQMGPIWAQIGFSKCLFASCKCWQRAFLVTKMHFALGNTKM